MTAWRTPVDDVRETAQLRAWSDEITVAVAIVLPGAASVVGTDPR